MTPAVPLQDPKRDLRAWARKALGAMPAASRDEDSDRLRLRLATDATFRNAHCILGFVALPSEPDLLPLLRSLAAEGRTILLPRFDTHSGEYFPAVLPAREPLVAGPFGVPEPPPDAASLSYERLDLILVPGLAFDRLGRRLGRGRGYYDRLLAKAREARKWGVAFDLQLVDQVPSESHDVNLDRIATPTHWVEPSADATR